MQLNKCWPTERVIFVFIWSEYLLFDRIFKCKSYDAFSSLSEVILSDLHPLFPFSIPIFCSQLKDFPCLQDVVIPTDHSVVTLFFRRAAWLFSLIRRKSLPLRERKRRRSRNDNWRGLRKKPRPLWLQYRLSSATISDLPCKERESRVLWREPPPPMDGDDVSAIALSPSIFYAKRFHYFRLFLWLIGTKCRQKLFAPMGITLIDSLELSIDFSSL